MPLETDLRLMGKHLVEVLEKDRLTILEEDEGKPAFADVKYGEPRVINQWPLLTVQPQLKFRELKGTRKFEIVFTIWLILYHGLVADTLSIQEGAHKRSEAIENYIMNDLHWNFVDAADSTKHKVIFGWVSSIDHPVVVAPADELWSSSRLTLVAESEEVF